MGYAPGMRRLLIALLLLPSVARPATPARPADPGATARGPRVTTSVLQLPQGAPQTGADVSGRAQDLLPCYAEQLARDPAWTASVVLSWTIQADGSVSLLPPEMLNDAPKPGAPAFLACLGSLASRWTFPQGKEPVRAEVLFTFTTKAPGPPVAMDKARIREAIRSHAAEIRACYERELVLDPKLEGKVTLRWIIREDGSATHASIDTAGTTLPNGRVPECMISHLRAWRFASPAGGGMAVITYPWVLRPGR